MILNSIGLITALVNWIGYDPAGKPAKEVLGKNESIYSLVLEKGIFKKTIN
jgi:aspartate ammonia-lyase